MENNLIKPARILLAIALVIFGAQHFIYKDFLPKLEPVPSWVPLRLPWAYLTGVILILVACSIASRIMDRLAAILMGIMFIACVFLFHLPILVSNLHNADKWACTFEELAIGSGALLLAGTLSPDRSSVWTERIIKTGRGFFALSLIIFGIQHFMYGEYIATLIPSWIPAHIFWAYFVGVVFISVALSIIINKKTFLAATLLGFMFFLWELSVHIPRVINNPHGMDEWTSAAVALAMCASSFVLATSVPGEQVPMHALQRHNF
jgi:uncharacterized membrane protein